MRRWNGDRLLPTRSPTAVLEPLLDVLCVTTMTTAAKGCPRRQHTQQKASLACAPWKKPGDGGELPSLDSGLFSIDSVELSSQLSLTSQATSTSMVTLASQVTAVTQVSALTQVSTETQVSVSSKAPSVTSKPKPDVNLDCLTEEEYRALTPIILQTHLCKNLRVEKR